MLFSPVTVTLLGFIGAVATLTGTYLVQCSLSRLVKSRAVSG